MRLTISGKEVVPVRASCLSDSSRRVKKDTGSFLIASSEPVATQFPPLSREGPKYMA